MNVIQLCSGIKRGRVVKGELHKGACGPVVRPFDSRSEGLGFDSQCWPCVEGSGKLRIPHCLGPPSHNVYLVHRSKVESIVAGCIGAHLVRAKLNMHCHGVWTLNNYLYLYLLCTKISEVNLSAFI